MSDAYPALLKKYKALDPERRRVNCFEKMLIRRIEDPFGWFLQSYPDNPLPLSDYALWVELDGGYPG